MKRIISIIALTLFTTTILLSTAFASTSKVATAAYLQSPAADANQYKVTISKDINIDSTHLELLPNNKGEYWIPKDYDIKVIADCKDGYKQKNNTGTIKVSESKNLQVTSEQDLITPYAGKNTLYYIGTVQYKGGRSSYTATFSVEPVSTIDCTSVPFYHNLTKDSFFF